MEQKYKWIVKQNIVDFDARTVIGHDVRVVCDTEERANEWVMEAMRWYVCYDFPLKIPFQSWEIQREFDSFNVEQVDYIE